MSTDIELRIRAALHAGAEAITDDPAAARPPSGPGASADTDVEAAPRRIRDHWAWIAAAASVAVIAGLVIALRDSGRPAPPARSVTPTISSPAPSPSSDIRPVSCLTQLPASWERALWTTGRVQPPSGTSGTAGLPILGMTPGGDVISSTSTSTTPQRLLRVRPDRSIDPLYTVPQATPGQGTTRIGGSAQADSRWVVFSLIVGDGQGARGGIDAVDLDTHEVRTIRSTDLGTELIVSEPMLLDGKVYWSEVTNAGEGHVYEYDLSSSARRTLDSGLVTGPQVLGGGVVWMRGDTTVVEHVPPTLPSGYSPQFNKEGTLLVDGSTSAWLDPQRSALRITTAAHPAGVTVYTAPNAILSLLALSGRYLFWSDGMHITVLDTRTGASSYLERGVAAVPQFDNVTAAGANAAVASGIVAATRSGASGGAELGIAPVSDLPDLRC